MDKTTARAIITAQLDDIAQQRARLQGDAASAGPPDQDVGDQVDTSQRLQAQNENSAMIAGLEREQVRLQDALARLDTGDYGICEVCGAKIEDERLEMIPWTRRDARHAPDPDNGA